MAVYRNANADWLWSRESPEPRIPSAAKCLAPPSPSRVGGAEAADLREQAKKQPVRREPKPPPVVRRKGLGPVVASVDTGKARVTLRFAEAHAAKAGNGKPSTQRAQTKRRVPR